MKPDFVLNEKAFNEWKENYDKGFFWLGELSDKEAERLRGQVNTAKDIFTAIQKIMDCKTYTVLDVEIQKELDKVKSIGRE